MLGEDNNSIMCEGPTAVNMKIAALWNIKTCSLVAGGGGFG